MMIDNRLIVGGNTSNGQFGKGVFNTSFVNLSCAELDAFVAEIDLRCVDAILFHYKIEYLCSNG